jgi:hypothetical protein
MLADGTFFPPGCIAILWGRASAPAGVAPEVLQERGCSCKGFSQSVPVCEVLVSAGIDNISASLGGAMHMYLAHVCIRCISRRCSHASNPRAWPSQGDRGVLSILFTRPFAVPPRDGGVRCPQLPSSGLRIAGSSLSCYRVTQVDAHALFDKGWLVVRRLVHENTYAGLLGRARSRSLGTEGVEALPRWNPSTSCPRWLLNTTRGAPSNWWDQG